MNTIKENKEALRDKIELLTGLKLDTKRRFEELTFARSIYCKICVELFGSSLASLQRELGFVSHASVWRSINYTFDGAMNKGVYYKQLYANCLGVENDDVPVKDMISEVYKQKQRADNPVDVKWVDLINSIPEDSEEDVYNRLKNIVWVQSRLAQSV